MGRNMSLASVNAALQNTIRDVPHTETNRNSTG